MANLVKSWVSSARPAWSNSRFANSLQEYTPQTKQINSVIELKAILPKLYSGFTYTYDDASKGFDAMDTPPQCLASLEAGNLHDDCDGYHAAIYHLLTERMPTAKNVRLLTVTTKPFWKSHTMCAFDVLEGSHMQTYLVNYKALVPLENDAAAEPYLAKLESLETTGIVADQWSKARGWYRI